MEGKNIYIYTGGQEIWKENVFTTRSNGLRENNETAISCSRLGPARKKRHTSAVAGKRRKSMLRCALQAKQKRVELTLWENVKCTRENRMRWR